MRSTCGLNAPHNLPNLLQRMSSVLAIATNFSLGPDVSFWGKAEVGRAAESVASVKNSLSRIVTREILRTETFDGLGRQ